MCPRGTWRAAARAFQGLIEIQVRLDAFRECLTLACLLDWLGGDISTLGHNDMVAIKQGTTGSLNGFEKKIVNKIQPFWIQMFICVNVT